MMESGLAEQPFELEIVRFKVLMDYGVAVAHTAYNVVIVSPFRLEVVTL